MSDFEKFKEGLSGKEKFYNLLTGKKKIVAKNMNMPLSFGINLELIWNKLRKIISTCT